MKKKIRLLIVDDSPVVQRLLIKALSAYDDIEVVGRALDPFDARDKILALRPDVLTLDVEMPRMDGITFLEKLMSQHPMPVVLVSSVAQKNSVAAMRALQLGACEVVPKIGSHLSLPNVERHLVHAIRAASVSRVHKFSGSAPTGSIPVGSVDQFNSATKLVVIGASTGGVRAIDVVMKGLPANGPGILIVQHMPPGFTDRMAQRLDENHAPKVKLACHGDQLAPGVVLIAPPEKHMILVRKGGGYAVALKQGPRINGHFPSVDALFHSVSRIAGENAMGVLLTGMGRDGANGLLSMRQHGCHTLAEAEQSCIVYGMPRAAVDLEAAVTVTPLNRIATSIVSWAQKSTSPNRVRSQASPPSLHSHTPPPRNTA